MPVRLPALASWARARKRWRQRNAVLGATSSVFAAAWMLSPWLSTWARASHLPLWRKRAVGVPVSALKVWAQALHL